MEVVAADRLEKRSASSRRMSVSTASPSGLVGERVIDDRENDHATAANGSREREGATSGQFVRQGGVVPVEFHRVRAGLSVGSFGGVCARLLPPRNGRLDPLIEKATREQGFPTWAGQDSNLRPWD